MDKTPRFDVFDPNFVVPAAIDMSQAHSLHDAERIAGQFNIDTNPEHTQWSGMREALTGALSELTNVTKEAFTKYEGEVAHYFEQSEGRIAALFNELEETKVVLDSLVKLMVLGEKMPPEVALQHQTVLADFIKRDLPANAALPDGQTTQV